MFRFFATIEASASYSITAPTIEALINGDVVSSGAITAQTGLGTTVLSFVLNFPTSQNAPLNFSFRFNDGSAEPRTVTINRVTINGQEINTTYISMLSLTQGQSANINTAATDFLYGIITPTPDDFDPPTIVGTGGDDVLRGTDGRDIINAGSGNDRIILGAGDNVVFGGAGNNTIIGGTGNDILIGGDGSDYIVGGAGDDMLYGEGGDDVLIGGAGNDILNGGDGDDTLFGDDGDDILYGGAGNDLMFGGNGNDTMFGGDGNDLMHGGAGNDIMYGGAGDDVMNGGAGDDLMYGEDGDDNMNGGAGNDTMYGGAGRDQMFGGAGNDTMYGGDDDDFMMGEAGNDIMHGDDGNDAINGGAGADTLYGGAGNDHLFGHGPTLPELSALIRNNAGLSYSILTNSYYMVVDTAVNYATALAAAQATVLNGVAGSLVTVMSAAENVYVQSLLGGNTAWLGATDVAQEGVWRWTDGIAGGVQFSSGATATNNMFTHWQGGQPNGGAAENNAIMNADGTWADVAAGGTHRYVIKWDAGLMNDDNAADILDGGAGNDMLFGYGGNDTLNGGDGNDILVGGAGADTINGGAGDDVIWLAPGDFAAGESIDGGTGNDRILLLAAMSVDFTTGTVVNVEELRGSIGSDTVTLSAMQFVGFTSIDLAGGTNVLNVRAAGDISAQGTPTVTNVSAGNLIGTAGTDVITLTGAQLNAILIGTGIVDMGGGTGNTINITSTSTALNARGQDDAAILGLSEVSATTAAAGVNIDLRGQSENLILRGGNHNDTIRGGNGDDVIYGGSGNDVLYGYGGRDIIYGGAGDDIIYGGGGQETLVSPATLTDIRINFNGMNYNNGQAGTLTLSVSFDGGVSYQNFLFNFTEGPNQNPTRNSMMSAVNGHADDRFSAINGDGTQFTIRITPGSGDFGPLVASAQYTSPNDNLNVLSSILTQGDNAVYTLTGQGSGDILYGEAGNDTIYSASVNTLTATIADILAANPSAIHLGYGVIIHHYTTVGTTTFTPHESVTQVEYLIVGGGGGGGSSTAFTNAGSGGGGAGGVVTGTMTVTEQPYTVTVGGGGATGATGNNSGQNGGQSVFDDIVALGGGGGIGGNGNGNAGGSGGGGRGGVGGAGQQPGSADGGFGNAGGGGPSNPGDSGGGGGGAGGVGGTLTALAGGNGGIGIISDITGTATYYGGGGGGGGAQADTRGVGGLGGGGTGANDANAATAGAANTGGGGGGGNNNRVGAAGGSGTVILRYDLTDDNPPTILAGGEGNDNLYGADGMDIFVFSHTGAAHVDNIYNFDTAWDRIDLSDLLTAFDPVSHAITNFVRITDSGGNSDLRVDVTGSANFGAATVVAVIQGVTGLTDEAALYNSGMLIVG